MPHDKIELTLPLPVNHYAKEEIPKNINSLNNNNNYAYILKLEYAFNVITLAVTFWQIMKFIIHILIEIKSRV